MGVRGVAVAAAVVVLAAAGCSSGDGGAEAKPSAAASKSSTVKQETPSDCEDPELSMEEWTEVCASEFPEGAGTGGDGTYGTDMKFGQVYEWADGLAVTVVDVREMPQWADPGETAFRIRLRLSNKSGAAVDLDGISTFIDGATNGGEAASTEFDDPEPRPLGGRLGAGVSAVFTDDNVLESRYGRAIVVTVQRQDFENPEYVGEIV